jgi:hypothetical protein
MKALTAILAASVLAACAFGDPPPPLAPYHLLLGPYDYDESGKHLPRFYTLDDKNYMSIDALKNAIARLPAGSTVNLRGSCEPYRTIELPPRPLSLSALRSYCTSHRVTFTWTFGPGGY